MQMSFLQFLAALIIQAVVFSLVLGKYLESRGWKIYYYLIQAWRTKKGIKLIDRIAKSWPGFWRVYGKFGIILAFGFLGGLYVFRKRPVLQRIILSGLASSFILVPMLNLATTHFGIPREIMVVGSYLFGYTVAIGLFTIWAGLYTVSGMIAGQKVVAMAGPAIPGINIKGSPIQNIPWFAWLVFPILLFVHEFSHGFLARLGKIRLKSVGVILMGIVPMGAFVEPDEKQIEKAKPEYTLPLFAAGSTANYLTAFIAFLLLFVSVPVLFQQTGVSTLVQSYVGRPVVVSSINPDIPAGVEIVKINNFTIRTIQDIHNATNSIGPGNGVVIQTNNGTIKTKLNSKGLLGVYLSQGYKPGTPWYIWLLTDTLSFIYYTFFFNLVIGLMNLIPMLPLDGGLMMKEFLLKVFGVGEKLANRISIFISLLIGTSLLMAMLPVILQF